MVLESVEWNQASQTTPTIITHTSSAMIVKRGNIYKGERKTCDYL